MSFGESIRTCLQNYGTFSGRAKRSEFWWFYLFCIIVNIVLYLPFLLLLSASSSGESGGLVVITWLFGAAWIIVNLALIIPQLAVGCRRLHDRGMSGWLQLLLLVPCASIVLIVFWALEGNPGDNQYGPATS